MEKNLIIRMSSKKMNKSQKRILVAIISFFVAMIIFLLYSWEMFLKQIVPFVFLLSYLVMRFGSTNQLIEYVCSIKLETNSLIVNCEGKTKEIKCRDIDKITFDVNDKYEMFLKNGEKLVLYVCGGDVEGIKEFLIEKNIKIERVVEISVVK